MLSYDPSSCYEIVDEANGESYYCMLLERSFRVTFESSGRFRNNQVFLQDYIGLALVNFLLTLTNFPLAATENHPRSMMLPWSSFKVEK